MNSTIGERIKTRREDLGMSQEELAVRLGYKSRSSVNKIEMESRNLTQSKIKAIADALNTTPSYIMGWDEQKDAPKPEPESVLPEGYELLTPANRAIVDRLIADLAKSQSGD